MRAWSRSRVALGPDGASGGGAGDGVGLSPCIAWVCSARSSCWSLDNCERMRSNWWIWSISSLDGCRPKWWTRNWCSGGVALRLYHCSKAVEMYGAMEDKCLLNCSCLSLRRWRYESAPGVPGPEAGPEAPEIEGGAETTDAGPDGGARGTNAGREATDAGAEGGWDGAGDCDAEAVAEGSEGAGRTGEARFTGLHLSERLMGGGGSSSISMSTSGTSSRAGLLVFVPFRWAAGPVGAGFQSRMAARTGCAPSPFAGGSRSGVASYGKLSPGFSCASSFGRAGRGMSSLGGDRVLDLDRDRLRRGLSRAGDPVCGCPHTRILTGPSRRTGACGCHRSRPHLPRPNLGCGDGERRRNSRSRPLRAGLRRGEGLRDTERSRSRDLPRRGEGERGRELSRARFGSGKEGDEMRRFPGDGERPRLGDRRRGERRREGERDRLPSASSARVRTCRPPSRCLSARRRSRATRARPPAGTLGSGCASAAGRGSGRARASAPSGVARRAPASARRADRLRATCRRGRRCPTGAPGSAGGGGSPPTFCCRPSSTLYCGRGRDRASRAPRRGHAPAPSPSHGRGHDRASGCGCGFAPAPRVLAPCPCLRARPCRRAAAAHSTRPCGWGRARRPMRWRGARAAPWAARSTRA
jgi:hypothetical protein